MNKNKANRKKKPQRRKTFKSIEESRRTDDIKSCGHLKSCAAPRFRNIDESSSTERDDDYCHKSTLPMRNPTRRSSRQPSLQRSRAVRGSDSLGSTDSNTLRPPSPEGGRQVSLICPHNPTFSLYHYILL
ncbi:uncharacterized protein CEXT_534531 [Caerostris extrusa]|uniref:Uncharacterized protein n=1 Tax=Caerostris extrusa TaxID=172846 RepID=A0AAV4Y150_CAEEX|nr:uncharacterized protein CEXT_534531 [Caerostris extrusa]